jgi:hypothetical protein
MSRPGQLIVNHFVNEFLDRSKKFVIDNRIHVLDAEEIMENVLLDWIEGKLPCQSSQTR